MNPKISFKKKTLHHIKFVFSATEARSGPPLGPIVAMFQLNITQVCKELNDRSIHYLPGVPLNAKLFKAEGSKTFKAIVTPPSLKFYLEMAQLSLIPESNLASLTEEELNAYVPDGILTVNLLYDVLVCYCKHRGLDINSSTAKTLFAHLSTYTKSALVKEITI